MRERLCDTFLSVAMFSKVKRIYKIVLPIACVEIHSPQNWDTTICFLLIRLLFPFFTQLDSCHQTASGIWAAASQGTQVSVSRSSFIEEDQCFHSYKFWPIQGSLYQCWPKNYASHPLAKKKNLWTPPDVKWSGKSFLTLHRIQFMAQEITHLLRPLVPVYES